MWFAMCAANDCFFGFPMVPHQPQCNSETCVAQPQLSLTQAPVIVIIANLVRHAHFCFYLLPKFGQERFLQFKIVSPMIIKVFRRLFGFELCERRGAFISNFHSGAPFIDRSWFKTLVHSASLGS
jgi:hypothetical protein